MNKAVELTLTIISVMLVIVFVALMSCVVVIILTDFGLLPDKTTPEIHHYHQETIIKTQVINNTIIRQPEMQKVLDCTKIQSNNGVLYDCGR